MKRNILILSLLMGSGIALLTGCSKDDETAPVITLTGASSLEISLNSPAWTDPGATANDDEDGTTAVTSDASSTNPNTNLVGTYTITYTSTDAAGNQGTAVRTIRVKNDAEEFAGSYDVHDTVPGLAPFIYTQEITVSTTVNNRVHFSRFADYANNTAIYAMKNTSGDLEIPLQTAVDIGQGAGTCDIATHKFSSTGFTSTTTGFILQYIDEISSPGSCIGTTTGTATYTLQ